VPAFGRIVPSPGTAAKGSEAVYRRPAILSPQRDMEVVYFQLDDWERQMFDTIRDGHDLLFTGEPLNTQTYEEFLDADAISANISNLNIHP
jgi:hypothetical protein